MLQSRKMSYEHNPRMAAVRTSSGQIEGFRTPYSGSKRNIQIQRSVKHKREREPNEKDALKSNVVLLQDCPISTHATILYGIVAYSQVLYTITLVCLVAAQASAELSVKVLLILLLVHNTLTALLMGMNQKIDTLCAKSLDTPYSGIGLLRHVREDRRRNLFFLSTVLSCLATIDVAYIARVANNWNTRADTFRSTGYNTVVNREMDNLSILVFALAVPVVLLLIAEISYGLQSMQQARKVQESSSSSSTNDTYDSDEEGVDIVSPK